MASRAIQGAQTEELTFSLRPSGSGGAALTPDAGASVWLSTARWFSPGAPPSDYFSLAPLPVGTQVKFGGNG